jgi:hypothetical protein
MGTKIRLNDIGGRQEIWIWLESNHEIHEKN